MTTFVRPMKILIVARDVLIRERLGNLLQTNSGDNQFVLYYGEDGSEALDVFAESHPDLVILSTEISQPNGAEVCSSIRKREGKRHTGVIFLAHDVSDSSAMSVQCLRAGADDFLRSDCSGDELLARVIAVLRLKTMTDELRSANHRLQMLSLTDDLTGLANMRSFNMHLQSMLQQCEQGIFGIGLIMMDLDHFKRVNDTADHLMGSYVIREVGKIIGRREIVGREDMSARYGGDEFVLACAVQSREEIEQIGELIRKNVAKSPFVKDAVSMTITSSVGVAYFPPTFKGLPENIIKTADIMLYRSKENGRNRVSSVEVKSNDTTPDDVKNFASVEVEGVHRYYSLEDLPQLALRNAS